MPDAAAPCMSTYQASSWCCHHDIFNLHPLPLPPLLTHKLWPQRTASILSHQCLQGLRVLLPPQHPSKGSSFPTPLQSSPSTTHRLIHFPCTTTHQACACCCHHSVLRQHSLCSPPSPILNKLHPNTLILIDALPSHSYRPGLRLVLPPPQHLPEGPRRLPPSLTQSTTSALPFTHTHQACTCCRHHSIF